MSSTRTFFRPSTSSEVSGSSRRVALGSEDRRLERASDAGALPRIGTEIEPHWIAAIEAATD